MRTQAAKVRICAPAIAEGHFVDRVRVNASMGAPCVSWGDHVEDGAIRARHLKPPARPGLSSHLFRAEPVHDLPENSHASTALSCAGGPAEGGAVNGNPDRATVAVIGDGALTGGMALKFLNNLGAAKFRGTASSARCRAAPGERGPWND